MPLEVGKSGEKVNIVGVPDAGSANQTSAAPVDPVVELYGPDFAHVYSVPRSGIYQMPPNRMHITRFCACKNFSNAVLNAAESGNPDFGTEAWFKTACPLDTFCRFVHVARPLSEFPRQAIHVHYIWRSLKEVTYETLVPLPTSTTTTTDDDDETPLAADDEPSSSPRVRLVPGHDYRNQILQMREQCDPEEASSPKVLIRDGDVDIHARAEPGTAFMIGVLAAVLPSVLIPATRLLKTAGALECLLRHQAGESVPVIELCFSFLIENECRMGSECPYAHAINLDSGLKVPFVRRTLRQIKKAAMAMELVRAEGGAFSTTAMSAGTSRGSTPHFLPQEYEFMDQLSLSFDSAVSNSVSEYSATVANNCDGHDDEGEQQHHHHHLTSWCAMDDILPNEGANPTMGNMMAPGVLLGGPPTPSMTPTSNHLHFSHQETGRTVNPDAQMRRGHQQHHPLPVDFEEPDQQHYYHRREQEMTGAANLSNPTVYTDNVAGVHQHHHHSHQGHQCYGHPATALHHQPTSHFPPHSAHQTTGWGSLATTARAQYTHHHHNQPTPHPGHSHLHHNHNHHTQPRLHHHQHPAGTHHRHNFIAPPSSSSSSSQSGPIPLPQSESFANPTSYNSQPSSTSQHAALYHRNRW